MSAPAGSLGAATIGEEIRLAVAAMGEGPLTEAALVRHVHPLFSRVLERDEIYLSNHSLGRPLDRTATDVARALDLWYRDLDGAWDAWLDEIRTFRMNIARLIGLSSGHAVVPKPGAGQGLRAVLGAIDDPCPRVVTTRGEFDSIDFILKTWDMRGRAAVRWVPPDSAGLFHADDVIRAIEPGTRLVVVSHVYFATGQILDGIHRVVHAAHERGALVLVDMYHSAGVLHCSLDDMGADFAIGGSYKYTRGGPGAGWLAVSPRHLAFDESESPALVPLDTGWFARRHVFDFARRDRPDFALGGDAWLECTPVILTAYQAKAGLELLLALGVERLRAYSLEQQGVLEEALVRGGVEVRGIDPRGAFMLLPHSDAAGMSQRLRAMGVNSDARPDALGRPSVRVCPDILNTREELERAAAIIARAWRA